MPALEARRAERHARIERARRFAADLAGELDIERATVFGSVARGDWNVWSDTDLLVITSTEPERSSVLDGRHPGVQAVVWSVAERDRRLGRRDPIATEAVVVGIDVTPMDHKDDLFGRLFGP